MAEDDAGYDAINDSLVEGGVKPEEKTEEYTASYKMMEDTKIPVSKSLGKLWKSRRDQAKSKLKNEGIIDAWEECIRYYNNDQVTESSVSGSPNTSRMARKGTGVSDEHIETENVVFANTTALVPATYAKNPDIEVTPSNISDEKSQYVATCIERLVNSLFAKKVAPGINLKPKARKAIIMCTLTNVAYIEIGYTDKEDSSETTLDEIGHEADRLAKAKSIQEIEEVEGCLAALEEKIDVLSPAGPWAKFRHPKDVLRDPSTTMNDLTDCNWLMIADYVPTNQLRAVYFKKNEDKQDQWESIYSPTHVLNAGASGGHSLDEEINNFSLLDEQKDFHSYGYDDEESYNRATYTKVWRVYDKVTRRLLLFHDKNWTWPIWVWDDPYSLTNFFPVYCLEFYTDPEGDYARSEVMYYLDQQDAINEIASERRRAIAWARKNLFYDIDAIKDPAIIEAFLRGAEKGGAIGVKVPEGKKMADLIFSVPPPSTQFMQLFDPQPYLQAIDRVSSVTNVMRGVEYKTNTTNKAIESYESQTQTRLDEKIDQIEEFIGNIGAGLLELCVSKMPAEMVAALTDEKCGQLWGATMPMSPYEFHQKFTLRCIGGSALKPTARAKKEEAIQVGQVLGQFGKAVPASMLVMMRVFERAFDEIVVTQEDWQLIRASIEKQLAPEPEPPPEQPQPQQPSDEVAEMEQMINQLPPQAKKALGDAMEKGVPIRQAMEEIMMRVQQSKQNRVTEISNQSATPKMPLNTRGQQNGSPQGLPQQ
jgi:hypothetical protein